jgi:small-conductance mechanosensitive channel
MLATTAWQAVKKIWSFEVMRYEDKVEVDGQTISGKIPITLGTLLRAVLFFLIGYWIAARIASHLQAGLVSRGHIAEAQAKTLRNWGMIVVSLFLVIGTLSFLKIPLTVFAFFGGALAIGLGFGSQTLIKNFISGIIVLAERKVRVGDLVDVDGVVGTVAEINTRSSVVRSGDDMETMIPNSVFLENRVTNWTLSSARVRRSLRVSVAYNTSPPQVMALLTEVAGRHGLICKEPVPFAVFEDFGENALVFGLYFWLELRGGTNPMIVTSDLRLMLEKRFAEVGISLPFPQRDVHLTSDKPLDVQWVGPIPPPPP